MTPQELFNKSPLEIRNSEPLMGFFLELFKEAYGYVPNCAGCTFNGYYNQLKDKYITKNSLNLTKNNFNSMRTFVLKRGLQNKQFMYKDNNRPVRTYGNIMTDEFALKYLEITNDLDIFEKLPDGYDLEVENENLMDENLEIQEKPKQKRNRKK